MDLAVVTAHLPPPPARVLEVGCGDGRLARALDDRGYRITAIDPDASEGPIFRSVALEDFDDPEGFHAALASRSLHHIHDLAAAVSKLRSLIVATGQLIVFEHAWERFDDPTARWYLARRGAHTRGDESVEACLAQWRSDHAELHSSEALLRELDRCFTERLLAPTPYLHWELGQAVEPEERRLIEAGAIQAIGFVYVGEPRGG